MSPKKVEVAGYELKVTLVGAEPAIWRQLQVPARLTLALLHRVLQASFGWGDYHLHEFVVGKERFAPPSSEDWGGSKPIDERRVTLGDLELRRGRKFRYLYDFGDDWEHELVVTKLLDTEPLKASCTGGERAGPPEDCGGVGGYADLLEALADPKHERHEELSEWIGEGFDPAAFGLEATNLALRKFR